MGSTTKTISGPGTAEGNGIIGIRAALLGPTPRNVPLLHTYYVSKTMQLTDRSPYREIDTQSGIVHLFLRHSPDCPRDIDNALINIANNLFRLSHARDPELVSKILYLMIALLNNDFPRFSFSRGNAIIIAGDTGIGKTRIADTLMSILSLTPQVPSITLVGDRFEEPLLTSREDNGVPHVTLTNAGQGLFHGAFPAAAIHEVFYPPDTSNVPREIQQILDSLRNGVVTTNGLSIFPFIPADSMVICTTNSGQGANLTRMPATQELRRYFMLYSTTGTVTSPYTGVEGYTSSLLSTVSSQLEFLSFIGKQELSDKIMDQIYHMTAEQLNELIKLLNSVQKDPSSDNNETISNFLNSIATNSSGSVTQADNLAYLSAEFDSWIAKIELVIATMKHNMSKVAKFNKATKDRFSMLKKQAEQITGPGMITLLSAATSFDAFVTFAMGYFIDEILKDDTSLSDSEKVVMAEMKTSAVPDMILLMRQGVPWEVAFESVCLQSLNLLKHSPRRMKETMDNLREKFIGYLNIQKLGNINKLEQLMHSNAIAVPEDFTHTDFSKSFEHWYLDCLAEATNVPGIFKGHDRADKIATV